MKPGGAHESGTFSRRVVRLLVVGGIERLDPFYRDAPSGVAVETIFTDGAALEGRALAVDAIVLVATVVSHSAAAKVRAASRLRGTPLVHARSAGVSQVRAALAKAFLAARAAAARRAS